VAPDGGLFSLPLQRRCVREYAFEMALCAHLETGGDALVARQVGGGVHKPGGRVLDVVCVAPGPEFQERAAIAPGRIPELAVESEVGPGSWRRPTEAIDASPERARAVAEKAVEVGFFEETYRRGRRVVRQVARYPDWVGTVTAIENKPDLGEPGALELQLRTDVSLGVADEVVLATESHVTGAHLNRIPDAVGVWQFRPDEDAGRPERDDEPEIEVVREPTPLDDGPGIELLERHPDRERIRPVTAAQKARTKRRIAERVYGKGWRPAELPACASAREGSVSGGSGLPFCAWKNRVVDPGSECGPTCPGYETADPPAADPDAERARRTPWVRDPEGRARRQSGLDRFG
jgi:hypothetical protein